MAWTTARATTLTLTGRTANQGEVVLFHDFIGSLLSKSFVSRCVVKTATGVVRHLAVGRPTVLGVQSSAGYSRKS